MEKGGSYTFYLSGDDREKLNLICTSKGCFLDTNKTEPNFSRAIKLLIENYAIPDIDKVKRTLQEKRVELELT